MSRARPGSGHPAPAVRNPPSAGSPAPAGDPTLLLGAARARMPFGKYAGRRLVDLPEPYLAWFSRQGFPRGRLGEELQLVYELKINGLEHLLAPLGGGSGSR